MHFKYGYGKGFVEFDVNDENIMAELDKMRSQQG